VLNRLSRGQAQIIDGIGCFKEFLAFQNEGLGPGFASGNFPSRCGYPPGQSPLLFLGSNWK